jgi:flavin reductase (DIM6/NTAB) family NADH-FMN oxidoreductase RutF
MTEVNFDDITSYERYKLMASLIVPRPIALVTTLGANGVVNAAPFSMFNMIGEDPPILMISINRLQDGQLKDTAANILHNGEFVVHMSDEPIAQKMHAAVKIFHPISVSCLLWVSPPCRLAPSNHPELQRRPLHLSACFTKNLETPSRYVFIGRIQWLAARDGLIDTQAWRVNLKDYRPVARFGASFYTRTDDRFAISDTEGDTPQNNTAIDQI